jgi:xanthine dehydrogenase YagS FAD-binding subunit
VIDLGGIAALKGIRETADGLEIGALTTLAEVANNALIRERYGLLAKAAAHVASPQIRNQGTLGGNVCQDARCWYYRSGLDCYRAGGNTCYADTPQGMNREHCLFGAERCIAVSPSDTATALVALDASFVAASGGRRVVRRTSSSSVRRSTSAA